MKIQTKYGEAYVLTDCPLIDSTESLEWLTAVHESYDGSEERYLLRDAPRQVLNFSYLAMRKAMGDMFHLLYANLRGQWAIPLPMVKRSIPDLDNEDYIAFDPTDTIADLRADSYALIRSDEGDQVVEIIARGRYIITQEEIIDPETEEVIQELETEYQDGFRLAEPVTATNAFIMPLRICILDGDASINAGHQWMKAPFVFRVLAEDLPEHEGDEPEQYKSKDIYWNPLILDGDSLEMTLTQHQNVVDNSVGVFQQFTHHSKPKYLKPFTSILKTWAEYQAYRRFLFRREGRFREFWMPLQEKHLNILNTANITTSLSTNTKYIVEANRKHIAVKRKDDTWSAHEITARTGGSLTVTPSIATHANDIDYICYLGLYRLDADQITFEFLGAGMSRVTVPIVEIES
ncbi:hypothetical protein ABEF79_06085 [Acinetobacter sp. ANC 7454]|uniref:hypothetical protein n=1 Tax=Acinetobacter thermotolerans TaxID=3151487 RepID=UPI00325C1825